jgi:hypothetical protein
MSMPDGRLRQQTGEASGIITQLNSVKSGTTAYPEAKRLLKLANNKLKQLQAK